MEDGQTLYVGRNANGDLTEADEAIGATLRREFMREANGNEAPYREWEYAAGDAAFRKETGSYLDVDNYLRFEAATAFVANADNHFFGHNYCLYLHPKTGKLHLTEGHADELTRLSVMQAAAQYRDTRLDGWPGGTGGGSR